MTKVIVVPCPSCGSQFSLNADKRFLLRKNPNKRTFCSSRCYTAGKCGSGNPNWRGGLTVVDGYVYVYTPDHPHATHDGYVLEHRLVMEEKCGRTLRPTETVHHIDGDTRNNAPENLALMADESEHRSLHAQYRTRDYYGRFSGHLPNVVAYL